MYADKMYVKVVLYEDTVPQRGNAKPTFDQVRSNILDLIYLTKKTLERVVFFLSIDRMWSREC